MTGTEIAGAGLAALFDRLREIQREFDAGEWKDPLPILREHYAVMDELKRRGLSELQIEVGTRIDLVT